MVRKYLTKTGNETMKKTLTSNRLIARSPLAAAVAFGLFAAPMAQAFDFGQGELKGSLDTTVSYGISSRRTDPSEGLIGKATLNPAVTFPAAGPGSLPGGVGGVVLPGLPSSINTHPGSPGQIAAPGRFSANRDDGNIKYGKGDLFSNAFKITSDLEVTYKDWGMFARASYFYDFENNGRDDMTEEALEKVGSDFRLYDAFIFKNYTLGEGGVSGSVRVGQQVINWGESTFIQGGINGANPIDVSRLRVAGAELKEAYLPVGMVWGSMQFSEAWSVEGYYQYEWTPTEIDPSGTYFSTNDFASPGGTYVMLGFGTVTQPVNNPENFAATCIIGKPASGQTNVGNSDRFAELSAQYGVAGATQSLATACSAAGPRLEPDREARDSGQFGVALRYYAEALNQTEFGFYAMNYHSRLPLLSGRAANVILPTPASNSAALIVEYPEDIHLFGMSFNTTLPGGVAWQGELSYRPNAPFQVDDVEVLFAGLSPINLALGASGAPPAVKL